MIICDYMQILLILLNLLGDVELCNACVSLITRITRLTLGMLLWMRALQSGGDFYCIKYNRLFCYSKLQITQKINIICLKVEVGEVICIYHLISQI